MIGFSRQWKSRRYELSCPIDSEDDNFFLESGLVIRVPKLVAKQLSVISADAPLIENYVEKFGFNRDLFTGDITGPFGFGGALERQETNNYFEFLGNLPESQTKKCEFCGGGDNNCRLCDGIGKVERVANQEVRRLLVSIHLLLWHLNRCDIESDLSIPQQQLLYVDTAFTQDSRGLVCGITGTYSKRLVRWLAQKPSMSVVRRTMKTVYERMAEPDPHQRWSESVRLRDGRYLSFHCAGERHSLNPVSRASETKGKYRFASHNVDTSLQVLTLLSGLAGLHDNAKHVIL